MATQDPEPDLATTLEIPVDLAKKDRNDLYSMATSRQKKGEVAHYNGTGDLNGFNEPELETRST